LLLPGIAPHLFNTRRPQKRRPIAAPSTTSSSFASSGADIRLELSALQEDVTTKHEEMRDEISKLNQRLDAERLMLQNKIDKLSAEIHTTHSVLFAIVTTALVFGACTFFTSLSFA
jgi:hypothetical protein